MTGIGRPAFENWAGTASCEPAHIMTVASEEGIAEAIALARRDGLTVKAVGSGHSFTDAACTEGVQVRLDGYRRILDADPGTGLVTVQAGITLLELNAELARLGLAMENLGDIAYQTVSGAISTATHGTGLRFGNLPSQVRALSLVLADGSVLRASAEQEPEVFRAARVSIGALGVLSTVTLQCVPAFNLHAVEEPMRLGEALERLDELAEANEHFEVYWFPHTDRVQTLRNNRTESPARPRSRVGTYLNDVLLENHAFHAILRLGRRRPAMIPRLSRFTANRWGRSERIEASDHVFASPRLVRFAEMEYGVPRERAADAIRAVRDVIEREALRISFPIEVRFTRGDDAYLSTAHGRDTCYVAVHVFRGMVYEPYFRAVEAAMQELDGRPHWGKLHFRTAADLAPAYPGWEDFLAVRRRLDPSGLFRNGYLDRVVGSP